MGARGSALTIRFPTSSAYWNLRAEQVMNKVFETATVEPRGLEPVEVAVHEPVLTNPLPQPTPAPAPQAPLTQPGHAGNGLIRLLTVMAVAGIGSSGWLLSHWQTSRDQLAEERSLLMLERLRSSTAPTTPEEETVPSLSRDEAPLASMAVAPLPPIPIPKGPMPQLIGVVQGPGGNSSAIFQLGASSLSAGLGDVIGSSGWALESVSATGAVIRRHGQRHTLAVGGVL